VTPATEVPGFAEPVLFRLDIKPSQVMAGSAFSCHVVAKLQVASIIQVIYTLAMALTKEQLLKLLENVDKDTEIVFIAFHDVEEGDVLDLAVIYHPQGLRGVYSLGVGNLDIMDDEGISLPSEFVEKNVNPGPSDEEREAQAAYDDEWRTGR
jgi:hypothetical protein